MRILNGIDILAKKIGHNSAKFSVGRKNRVFYAKKVCISCSSTRGVTRDNCPISSTSTWPVTRDGRTILNSTVIVEGDRSRDEIFL